MTNREIDGGTPFDWGRTSLDYAKFRDIYPEEFYRKIVERRLCMDGQSVLDVGTGVTDSIVPGRPRIISIIICCLSCTLWKGRRR